MRRLVRYAPWIVLAVALANVLAFRGVGPLDDDFVFHRYARGILERGEIAFNPGQRVEGFVAPLWLALLTGAMALGVEPFDASRALGVVSALGTAFLASRLWRARHPARFPFGALLVASLPALGYHALSGLGTTPLAFVLVAWAWSWRRALEAQRSALGAGAWLGAASLLRPEALLYALPFSFVELRRRRVASVGAAWLPPLLWAGFRRAYFGTWLPNPFWTKRLGVATDLAYGLEYLGGATLEVGAGAWCLACMVALAAGWRAGGDRFHTALLVGWLLHAASVVALGGDYMRFSRLFVPLLPLATYSTQHALVAFAENVARRTAVRRVAAGLGALLFLLPQGSQHMRRGAAALYHDQEERWRAVGRELAKRTAPDAHIAVSAIGAIGYESERWIVDTLGLTHDAFRDVPPNLDVAIKGHHRYDPEWVLAQDPDLVVPSNARLRVEEQFYLLWERDLLVDPDFARRYRPIELSVSGSYPLVCFARRGSPLPAGAREL